MSENFIKTSSNNWKNCTFIFPCVRLDSNTSGIQLIKIYFLCLSIGNIAQLAVDLLISSLPNVKKAGYFNNHSIVQSILGYNPYNETSGDLSLTIEFYECEEMNLIIMQQRAPLLKGKRNEFVRMLIDFIKNESFAETICLTSSYAYERVDSQLSGDQCRYLSTGNIVDKLVQDLNWLQLEKRNNSECTEEKSIAYLPGGGIAQKFYKLCKDEQLNAKILIIFAHEGNNIPEAFDLINYLNSYKNYLIKCNRSQWQVPISWKYLFGQGIDVSVRSTIF